MRVFCVILCALLFFSLASAIFNSLQGNSHGSSSFCKRPGEPFRPDVLCPGETMFFYYSCCSHLSGNGLKCCAELWVVYLHDSCIVFNAYDILVWFAWTGSLRCLFSSFSALVGCITFTFQIPGSLPPTIGNFLRSFQKFVSRTLHISDLNNVTSCRNTRAMRTTTERLVSVLWSPRFFSD
ncbi:unnamed protein product [Angiostrongylus costaricensis]|uniref:Secreted protein n=1 Tax=Angiostrongylus costaricensis TaxID=334426 RepID=A0A0R3PYE0_ANGCS|nr:unnamed protein product [Angiostrongylus costaricensis]